MRRYPPSTVSQVRPMKPSVISIAAGVICCACPVAAISSEKVLEWDFHVVGTPDFLGAPKINDPEFVPVAPLSVHMPTKIACQTGYVYGEFEAYINAQGEVESVHSHHHPVAGNVCQKNSLFPVIKEWKFTPARYNGKSTPVYLWIGIQQE